MSTNRSLLAFAALAAALPGIGRAAEAEITVDEWAEGVSFKPDLDTIKVKPGKKVKKSNLATYAALVPEALQMLIREHGLKLKLRAYEPIRPPEGYVEATNRYRGQAKLLDNGDDTSKRGIENYSAGLPFPRPATGREVAWDFRYAPGGDDAEVEYSVYWISGRSGLEHSEEWRLSMIRAVNRTQVEPIPAIRKFADKGLQGAGLTYALAPYDKKGFGAVYHTSVVPKDGQGHIYVPAMRRVLHNSFGTRGDAWNSTDLFYEDVRGYSGYPEWMSWKLVEKKTVLLPMHSGVELGKSTAKKTYDMNKAPHWNPKYEWEPRPVYVLEAKPKLPDYPYSRQLLYIDAEAFAILYKEAYDRKGELWKVLINSATEQTNEGSGETILGWSGTVVIDVQANHATLFHVHKARVNVGLDPDMFTVSNLRKRSR